MDKEESSELAQDENEMDPVLGRLSNLKAARTLTGTLEAIVPTPTATS